MKHLFCLIIPLSFFLTAQAQEIRPVSSTFQDYLPVLKDSGYSAFSFDISSLQDSTYRFEFIIKEYEHGEMIEEKALSRNVPTSQNRMMLSLFSHEDQKTILESGQAYDAAKGIYKVSKRFTIGFHPTSTDSLVKMIIDLKQMMTLSRKLSLKPLDAPGHEGDYQYDMRSFKVHAFKPGEFIPLVLIGSFWWDERFKIIRSCGESELPADMRSDMFKRMPHYYVIGVALQIQ